MTRCLCPDCVLRRFVFQPIADAVMNRWQKSCFWLAGQCSATLIGSAVAAAAADLASVGIEGALSAGAWVAAMMVWVAAMMVCGIGLRHQAVHSESLSHRGLLSPVHFSRAAVIIRGLWVSFAVNAGIQFGSALYFSLPSWVRQGTVFATVLSATSGYFFLACIPKPPRRKPAKAPAAAVFAGSAA